MFAATKVWRKWTKMTPLTVRRHAVAAAIAASAVPALVLARGHRVEAVCELPLVIDGLNNVEKTKELIDVL
jgi:large subunit ribosomal protein L4e